MVHVLASAGWFLKARLHGTGVKVVEKVEAPVVVKRRRPVALQEWIDSDDEDLVVEGSQIDDLSDSDSD